jgi:hypothetical protein
LQGKTEVLRIKTCPITILSITHLTQITMELKLGHYDEKSAINLLSYSRANSYYIYCDGLGDTSEMNVATQQWPAKRRRRNVWKGKKSLRTPQLYRSEKRGTGAGTNEIWLWGTARRNRTEIWTQGVAGSNRIWSQPTEGWPVMRKWHDA